MEVLLLVAEVLLLVAEVLLLVAEVLLLVAEVLLLAASERLQPAEPLSPAVAVEFWVSMANCRCSVAGVAAPDQQEHENVFAG